MENTGHIVSNKERNKGWHAACTGHKESNIKLGRIYGRGRSRHSFRPFYDMSRVSLGRRRMRGGAIFFSSGGPPPQAEGGGGGGGGGGEGNNIVGRRGWLTLATGDGGGGFAWLVWDSTTKPS